MLCLLQRGFAGSDQEKLCSLCPHSKVFYDPSSCIILRVSYRMVISLPNTLNILRTRHILFDTRIYYCVFACNFYKNILIDIIYTELRACIVIWVKFCLQNYLKLNKVARTVLTQKIRSIMSRGHQ